MSKAAELTREAIPDDGFLQGPANHPDARKPLSAFQSITAACGDCGHGKVLDRDRLMSLSAVPTFADLWRHAYCAECRAMGSTRRNVQLHGLLLEPRRELKPHWSDKKVFGEDRSDPFPSLPRRRFAVQACQEGASL